MDSRKCRSKCWGQEMTYCFRKCKPAVKTVNLFSCSNAKIDRWNIWRYNQRKKKPKLDSIEVVDLNKRSWRGHRKIAFSCWNILRKLFGFNQIPESLTKFSSESKQAFISNKYLLGLFTLPATFILLHTCQVLVCLTSLSRFD